MANAAVIFWSGEVNRSTFLKLIKTLFTIFILIFSFQPEQHRRFYQYQRRAQRRLWVLSIIVLFRKAPLLFFFFTPQKKKKRKA
jgi:hypothetical protein